MSEMTNRPSVIDSSRPTGPRITAGELYSREMERLSMPASLRNAILNGKGRERPRGKRWLRPVAGCAAALLVACGAWRITQWAQAPTVQPGPSETSGGLSQGAGLSPSSSSKMDSRLSFPLVEGVEVDASRRYLPGFFTEAPDAETLSTFLGGLPEAFPDWQIQALVGYSGEGEAVEMTAALSSPSYPEVSLLVESGTVRCYPLPEEGADESRTDGVQVVSGRYALGEDGKTSYYATVSSLSDSSFSITIQGTVQDPSSGEEVADLLDRMIQQIIAAGIDEGSRTGDLTLFTPTQIPQWRDERLTLQQAREDSDFGSHLPSDLPAGFVYEGEQPAHRVLGQNQNDLFLLAYRTDGGDYSEISLRYGYESGEREILEEGDRAYYDLTPYSIPWADTMPEQLRESLEDPLFSAQGLTLEMVQSRCYSLDDQGDADGIRCCFSVQFADGVVAQIRSKGLTAEEIFQLVQDMK